MDEDIVFREGGGKQGGRGREKGGGGGGGGGGREGCDIPSGHQEREAMGES